ncbi:MAG: antitoxin [Acidobacteria bacterium 13_1_20CM_3_53_8]|nr:MAG: antitoxin [Acidobacteria bacterium 13_1_20CM_3_53_8]
MLAEQSIFEGVKVLDRITVNPKIHFGKPCITGTRITVQSVLELLDEGLSFAEIAENYYPELQEDDIHACLRYAIALVAAEDIDLASVTA